jgi:hypothetical protein
LESARCYAPLFQALRVERHARFCPYGGMILPSIPTLVDPID